MMGNTENAGTGYANRRRIMAWGAAALLLALPWVAMQFTNEVAWDVADFVIFGSLLLVAGGACELAVRKSDRHAYRMATVVAVAAAFLLVWVNGAVGLIGSEDNDANLIYGGVLAIGLIGAFVARFRSAGMARAMFATALAQGLVAVIALIAGWGGTAPNWPWDMLGATGIFTALWLGAAVLYRHAAFAEGDAPAEV